MNLQKKLLENSIDKLELKVGKNYYRIAYEMIWSLADCYKESGQHEIAINFQKIYLKNRNQFLVYFIRKH